jgi:formate hydrogenlyase subunit 3/multisubunit Na+/H+ antiporter MnhD subunit
MAEKKETNKKRKAYPGEIIWYSILGAFWLIGFVLAILGVLAYNIGTLADNPLYQAEKAVAKFFGKDGAVFDFRLFGALFMLVTMIIFLIVIFYYVSKHSAKLAEQKRKEERLRILMSEEDNTQNN